MENRAKFDGAYPWFFDRRRLMLEVSVTESFDSFLTRLSSQPSSGDAIARGVAIESYSGAQGDGPKITSDKHILTMGLKHASRFEIGHGANRRMSYVRQPGSLSLVPAGVRPVMRAETDFDLVACALDSGLVRALDSELGCRPKGELRLQLHFQDPAAQQLMTLLLADAQEGFSTERLYTEYLAQALAVRMLYQHRQTSPRTNHRGASALPRHVLQRVV